MKTKSLLLIPVLAIAIAGCTRTSNDQSAGDRVAAKIKLQDLNGQLVDLDQFKGKTIFLNFWATWCRPCIEEMPSIASAKKNFEEKDILFLFASDEEIKRIQSFEKKNNLGLTYVQVTNFEELNILALPTTYIINTKGEIAFSETGFRKWDDPDNIELLTKIIETHE